MVFNLEVDSTDLCRRDLSVLRRFAAPGGPAQRWAARWASCTPRLPVLCELSAWGPDRLQARANTHSVMFSRVQNPCGLLSAEKLNAAIGPGFASSEKGHIMPLGGAGGTHSISISFCDDPVFRAHQRLRCLAAGGWRRRRPLVPCSKTLAAATAQAGRRRPPFARRATRRPAPGRSSVGTAPSAASSTSAPLSYIHSGLQARPMQSSALSKIWDSALA